MRTLRRVLARSTVSSCGPAGVCTRPQVLSISKPESAATGRRRFQGPVVVRAVTYGIALLALMLMPIAQRLCAQNAIGNAPFTNYFVTGDYVVGGWVENTARYGAVVPGYATGTISIPDCKQYTSMGQTCPAAVVPAGADIVAAYLYWGTVEGNQSSFAGQQAYFNGYKITGTLRGNPNAPTSWSTGGCTGGSNTGSKTMRLYRADVRPFLPLDINSSSPTFGGIVTNPSVQVLLSDSGSNGNTQPNALGATLVLIYRVTSPKDPMPLNAVVLYDGSYAPSNSNPTMTQSVVGFYQADTSGPVAKLTQIVANGQANKGEQVYFGPTPSPATQLPGPLAKLPILYPGSTTPFPGVYGAWDNPTWSSGSANGVNYSIGSLVGPGTSVTTFVQPTSTNSGCVNWGAIVFSTTVQDSDHDGLLDVWEQNQGYTDAVTGNAIALPGANSQSKDLFVELDYLTARDSSGNVLHSHLPKQDALDAVGQTFANQGINVHFDLPSGIYAGDPYVVSTGIGGNEIPESSLLCTDPAPGSQGSICAFPNQAAISWKGGFSAVQNDPNFGNFQPGRAQSYRYVLSGHAMGEPRSYWSSAAPAFVAADPLDLASSMPQLVSIVVTNGSASVTIKTPTLINGVPPLTPPLMYKPGDCTKAKPGSVLPAVCADGNGDRVTISGSLDAPFVSGANTQPVPPLNGTYTFTNVNSSAADGNGMITTTFNIVTSGVPDGTYEFSCPATQTSPPCVADPQLGVSYLGPTSSSGHADFGGGADVAMMLGLWGADDPKDPITGLPNCQADPSAPLGAYPAYCNNQVGTLSVQTGTLMHELGHTLTLTHGGTYYNDANDSTVASYEGNCKPNFISVMNYLFQVRGFVDGGFDYSAQLLPPLNESTTAVNGIAGLNESAGLGLDDSGQPAAHLTRWYSSPNAVDLKLQDQAIAHCDGSPMAQNENPAVRVNATVAPGGNFSSPLDWNNDLNAPDAVLSPGEDLNHNGLIGDAPFSGFDDWANINLQQTNARSSGFGFSEGGGVNRVGGGINRVGGGVDSDGGGVNRVGGGVNRVGGGVNRVGGGIEQDTETANATVGAPTALGCTQSLTASNGTIIRGCTVSTGSYLEQGKSIPLSWNAPTFGQIRSYSVWRALGSFANTQQVLLNISKFSRIATITGAPPTASYIDSANLKNNGIYTYFIADSNKFSAQSGGSAPLIVTVKF